RRVGSGSLASQAGQGVPVNTGQPDIDQSDLGPEGLELVEAARSILRCFDLVTRMDEEQAEPLSGLRIVLDDEDASPAARKAAPWRLHGRLGVGAGDHRRQAYDEPAATAAAAT